MRRSALVNSPGSSPRPLPRTPVPAHVAGALKTSVGAVKVRLWRLRRLLADRIWTRPDVGGSETA